MSDRKAKAKITFDVSQHNSLLSKLTEVVARREGQGINQACKEGGWSMTTVRAHRKRYPELDKQIKTILARRFKINDQGASKYGEDWMLPFVKFYQESGDRVSAAIRAGVTASDVNECITPNSDRYCEVLAAEVADKELADLWKMEDDEKRTAIVDGRPQSRQYFLDRLVERYRKANRTPEGLTTNMVVFTGTEIAGGMEKLKEALQVIELEADSKGGFGLASENGRGLPEAGAGAIDA